MANSQLSGFPFLVIIIRAAQSEDTLRPGPVQTHRRSVPVAASLSQVDRMGSVGG